METSITFTDLEARIQAEKLFQYIRIHFYRRL